MNSSVISTITNSLKSGQFKNNLLKMSITDQVEHRKQIEHGLHQVQRFSRVLQKNPNNIERLVQLGLNWGRTQELLCSIGGKDFWWGQIQPVIGDWKKMELHAALLVTLFELTPATEKFLNQDL